jgi:hypothetical protein
MFPWVIGLAEFGGALAWERPFGVRLKQGSTGLADGACYAASSGLHVMDLNKAEG